MDSVQFEGLPRRVAECVMQGYEAIDFKLLPHQEPDTPPESRGVERDAVRLLVSRRRDESVAHACFRDLPELLVPGDVLVINASSTGGGAAGNETIFATEPGSALVASAARPFTPSLVTRLVSKGVLIAPLVLHTAPSPGRCSTALSQEYFRIPSSTAWLVNAARTHGQRVIAVGTTVLRALETAAMPDGTVRAMEGTTELAITPQRGVRTVSGIVTGLHRPRSTHLLIIETLLGIDRLTQDYGEALRARYLWGGFGDLHLILR